MAASAEKKRNEIRSHQIEWLSCVLQYFCLFFLSSSTQIHLLRDKLYEAESIIQVGLGRYTWQTLDIKSFCESCEKLLKSLAAVVVQIAKMGKDIRAKVNKLESYTMFEDDKGAATTSPAAESGMNDEKSLPLILKSSKMADSSETWPDDMDDPARPKSAPRKKKSVRLMDHDDSIRPCLEYFKNLEYSRYINMDLIKKLYSSIGPTMIKLESLILGTFTGESEKMNHYYTHWEKELFTSLTRFTTRNLQEFNENLMGSSVMFEVNAVLATPEIIMKPTANEIYNILTHSVKDFLERCVFVGSNALIAIGTFCWLTSSR